MSAQQRRAQLVALLQDSNLPITGANLANMLGVSRQVIVTDVAILRAKGTQILATPQGYMLTGNSGDKVSRTIAVKHAASPQMIKEELDLIVDNGGFVRDVIVEHPLYGEIRGLLMLKSRKDVAEYLERMQTHDAEPLSVLTEGVHLHTIEADDDETIKHIEEELAKAGYALDLE